MLRNSLSLGWLHAGPDAVPLFYRWVVAQIGLLNRTSTTPKVLSLVATSELRLTSVLCEWFYLQSR
jgi:hypothetical protein